MDQISVIFFQKKLEKNVLYICSIHSIPWHMNNSRVYEIQSEILWISTIWFHSYYKVLNNKDISNIFTTKPDIYKYK